MNIFRNGFVFLILANILLGRLSLGFDFVIISGIVGIGAAVYNVFQKYMTCRSECCKEEGNEAHKHWIPVDIEGLSDTLKSKLYGQHLVRKVVTSALKAHFSDPSPNKALVLSFHGWTGGGKNYASRMIAENIYKKGMDSKYVHMFVSTINFPHEDKVDIYKLEVQDWIRGNVTMCERSLFIFDEIDKMPVGLIDAIKPFIDYHDRIFGLDFRKSVFIFLSNTGSREIIKTMLEHWRAGKERSEITYDDMEDLVQKGAFNEKGGLHQSDLIQHSLIDFYVPFLPLERRHVDLCVKDEFRRRREDPSEKSIRKIVDSMMFFPPEDGLYSTKGCKSVSSKVGYLLAEEDFDNL